MSKPTWKVGSNRSFFSTDDPGGACSFRSGVGAACRRIFASSVDTNHSRDIGNRSTHVANGAANNVVPIDRSPTIAATREGNFAAATTANTNGETLYRA